MIKLQDLSRCPGQIQEEEFLKEAEDCLKNKWKTKRLGHWKKQTKN